MIICVDRNELFEIGHRMISDACQDAYALDSKAEKIQLGYIAGISDAISEIVRYAEEQEKERKKNDE